MDTMAPILDLDFGFWIWIWLTHMDKTNQNRRYGFFAYTSDRRQDDKVFVTVSSWKSCLARDRNCPSRTATGSQQSNNGSVQSVGWLLGVSKKKKPATDKKK